MEVKTQMRNDHIEIQFSDCFSVADHAAVQYIVEVLASLRKTQEIKNSPNH